MMLGCWLCGSHRFWVPARVNADVMVDAATGTVVSASVFGDDLGPERDDPDGEGLTCVFCGVRMGDKPNSHDEVWTKLESDTDDLLNAAGFSIGTI